MDVKRWRESVVPSSFLSSKSCFHDPVRFNELLQVGGSQSGIVLGRTRMSVGKQISSDDFSIRYNFLVKGSVATRAGRLRELNCNMPWNAGRERASSCRPSSLSLSLSLPPSPVRYIKQASNNRISSVVLRTKLLIKCNGVTQLLCP